MSVVPFSVKPDQQSHVDWKHRAEVGGIYQHRKGGIYMVLFLGTMERDRVTYVAYDNAVDKTIWLRPKAEFEDGRFTRIPAFGEDYLD